MSLFKKYMKNNPYLGSYFEYKCKVTYFWKVYSNQPAGIIYWSCLDYYYIQQ